MTDDGSNQTVTRLEWMLALLRRFMSDLFVLMVVTKDQVGIDDGNSVHRKCRTDIVPAIKIHANS